MTEYDRDIIINDDLDNATSERREAASHKGEPEESRKLDDLSQRLQQGGVLKFIPEVVRPGMPYVIPIELAESGMTEYTYPHILRLAQKGDIESFQIGSHFLLTLRGTRQLLDRQQESIAGNLSTRGSRPGERRGRQHR